MKIILKNIIHKALEDRGSIGETKGYYHKFIVAVVCLKGGIWYVFFAHSYLMISESKVQLFEHSCSF